MPIHDRSIDRDSAARSNDNDLSGENCLSVHFDNLIAPENAGRLRKEVEHVLNGTTPTTYSKPLKDLRCKNECSNDQRREELADCKRGDKGDGHGEFHGHAALDDVLECFLEDGISADECGDQANNAYPMKRLPKMEPDCCCRQCDKDHAKNFKKFKTMFVIIMMVMILAVRMILGVIRRRLRQVNACLGYFPEISVCFVPVYNGHNASEPLVEIPLDHRNQLVRSLKLRRKCLQLGGENVKANVSLDQLGHQAV